MNKISRHPSTLKIYFGTELWERYGFYVVQSLLALYLAGRFGWPDRDIYSLVGSFTALTYLSPVIGGWIADHLIGQKRAVLTGACILGLSYFFLFIISLQFALMCALAGIAVGTGLLKPNISSLLGNDYPPESPQRDSGFTIFYLGITSGIILGTTLPSYLYYYFGWSATFGSAAIGMIIAMMVFGYGMKHYHIQDYTVHEFSWKKVVKACVLVLFLWSFSLAILSLPLWANVTFGLVTLGSIAYVAYLISTQEGKQAQETLVIGMLCLISIVFWSFYFQMFLSLTLFISRLAQPHLLGLLFPPPYYVSVQSLGMLVFGLLIARQKPKVRTGHPGIRTGNKFLLSMLFMCLAYALITLVCQHNPGNALISPWLILPAYLLISLAELFLSPVGLAAVTILASRENVSTMMGIFFVSLGVGGFLSGKLAGLTAVTPDLLTTISLKVHYTQGFTELFIILLVATICCVLLNIIIRRILTGLNQE